MRKAFQRKCRIVGLNRFVILFVMAWIPVWFGNGLAEEQSLSKPENKTLHVIGTAHLDTQWRWTIRTTIDDYIPKTLRSNFLLFQKYPDYTFSFEGAFRYMLAKEYYPADYEKLKRYIAEGRWRLAGSSLDAGDSNIPSPEAIIRSILLGQRFFRREFGKTSRDIFLPDCFGFGYALPAVAAHCGLLGFSTQKLSWGSAYGIPFDVGMWEGVDGSAIVAELKPGSYGSSIRTDLSRDPEWLAAVHRTDSLSGVPVAYRYFGTGDTGGAPDDSSVFWLEKSIHGDGSIRVRSAASDELCRTLSESDKARLPRWKGELLMTAHGTGCYTSEAAMKQWNRKNEQLADAAERASVAADWLGGAAYPDETLRTAWTRFLWHQFHDDLTGTSIPQAYTFSWNDELLSLNQFASILENSVGAVCRGLDTRVKGVPIVVYNPLAVDREDAVDALVDFGDRMPEAVRVFGPDGEVPSQMDGVENGLAKVVFLVKAPSVGFTVYDVRPSNKVCPMKTELRVSGRTIENARYRAEINGNGDVASFYDKSMKRELLASPIRLELLDDSSSTWPAWELMFRDLAKPPRAYVDGPARIRIVESGSARASLEVIREKEGSTFTQLIRLASGEAGSRIEFENRVFWNTRATLLKAAFPMTVSNPKAVYDLGLGVIERGTDTEKLYEVPAQQWADLSAPDGSGGVTIMNDCKTGWDKPDDRTLRLSLIHTPATESSYSDQNGQDLGNHRFTFSVAGHPGDWRNGRSVWEAARLNQPLMAFQTLPHKGRLGRTFSFVGLNTDQVAVRAVKKAEDSNEIVIRLIELEGRRADAVQVRFSDQVKSVRELNGAEEPVSSGSVVIVKGVVMTSFSPFQTRTLAVKLADPSKRLQKPMSLPVGLTYDLAAASPDSARSSADFTDGHSYPAELWPKEITFQDVAFKLGPADGRNALVCRGNHIDLPAGDYNRIYVLAASADGDRKAAFKVDGRSIERTVPFYSGFIGQWDYRQGDALASIRRFNGRDIAAFQIEPEYVKKEPVAWAATHLHTGRPDGNEAYTFGYFFALQIDLPPDTKTLTLPDDEAIRVFAVTLAKQPNADTRSAFDPFDPAPAGSNLTIASDCGETGQFSDSVVVTISSNRPGDVIRYTLDGSMPGPSSIRYAGPIMLKETTVLSARAFGSNPPGFASQRCFFKVDYLEPERTENRLFEPGLVLDYYEGHWQRLPDFEDLTPVWSAVVNGIGLPDKRSMDDFGLRWSGFIQIPVDGLYTFTTSSDDGSKLWIGDVETVTNDGLHDDQEATGMMALKAGMHRFRMAFFEASGDESCRAVWEGPGIARQPIPKTALWHENKP
jgi:alpha-mannosidase